jgi:hypothetical protein
MTDHDPRRRPPDLFRLRKPDPRLDDILDGDDAGDEAVGRLLRAARGPATPDELGGLDAATAAFRAVHDPAAAAEDAPPHHKASLVRRFATATLATKLLLGSAAAVAAGAVTYAAVDVTRRPDTRPPPAPVSSTNAPPTGSGTQPSSPSGTTSRTGSPTDLPSGSVLPSTGGSAATSGTPTSVALTALCRSWLAEPNRSARLAASAPYRPLVRVAGSTARVEGYCVALVGRAPSTSGTSSTSSTSSTRHTSGSSTPSSSTSSPASSAPSS